MLSVSILHSLPNRNGLTQSPDMVPGSWQHFRSISNWKKRLDRSSYQLLLILLLLIDMVYDCLVSSRFMTMGEMFPSGKLDGRVIKIELRNILNQLSLPVEDDEFEKLWQRWLFSILIFAIGTAVCMNHEGMTLKGEALFQLINWCLS